MCCEDQEERRTRSGARYAQLVSDSARAEGGGEGRERDRERVLLGTIGKGHRESEGERWREVAKFGEIVHIQLSFAAGFIYFRSSRVAE